MKSNYKKDAVKIENKFSLYGLGCMLSVGISYAFNENVLLAILQGLLSWTYVSFKIIVEYVI